MPKSTTLTAPSGVSIRFDGRHVTMHDPVRVRRVDGLGRLGDPPQRLVVRDGRLSHTVSQRSASDQLHHDVRPALPFADVVDRRDVGRTDARGRPRLAREPAPVVLVGRQGGREDLHGHGPPQLDVRGAVDLGHAPDPDQHGVGVPAGDRRRRTRHPPQTTRAAAGPRRTRVRRSAPSANLYGAPAGGPRSGAAQNRCPSPRTARPSTSSTASAAETGRGLLGQLLGQPVGAHRLALEQPVDPPPEPVQRGGRRGRGVAPAGSGDLGHDVVGPLQQRRARPAAARCSPPRRAPPATPAPPAPGAPARARSRP